MTHVYMHLNNGKITLSEERGAFEITSSERLMIAFVNDNAAIKHALTVIKFSQKTAFLDSYILSQLDILCCAGHSDQVGKHAFTQGILNVLTQTKTDKSDHAYFSYIAEYYDLAFFKINQ